MPSESTNRAPQWRPGMERIEGIAAHPSTQRKTTPELRERLADLSGKLRSATRDFADHPEPDQVEGLLASYQQSIAAVELALAWRGEAAR